jgi:putative transposase
MSRAGTPTDNGYAEHFVGLFKLAVAERQPYRTLGDFLRNSPTVGQLLQHHQAT